MKFKIKLSCKIYNFLLFASGMTAVYSAIEWSRVHSSEIKSYLPALLHEVFALPIVFLFTLIVVGFFALICYLLRKAGVVEVDDKSL